VSASFFFGNAGVVKKDYPRFSGFIVSLSPAVPSGRLSVRSRENMAAVRDHRFFIQIDSVVFPEHNTIRRLGRSQGISCWPVRFQQLKDVLPRKYPLCFDCLCFLSIHFYMCTHLHKNFKPKAFSSEEQRIFKNHSENMYSQLERLSSGLSYFPTGVLNP